VKICSTALELLCADRQLLCAQNCLCVLHLESLYVVPALTVTGQFDTDGRGECSGHGTSFDWPAVCPAPGGMASFRHCTVCCCIVAHVKVLYVQYTFYATFLRNTQHEHTLRWCLPVISDSMKAFGPNLILAVSTGYCLTNAVLWDFKFSRLRVWSSDLSFWMYCRVK